MFSKDRVVIPSNTARFAKRLAQPFTKQNLLCAVRAIAPALFALTLSSAAQGTMDFSGAQTLMGTFKSHACHGRRTGGWNGSGETGAGGRIHSETGSVSGRVGTSSRGAQSQG